LEAKQTNFQTLEPARFTFNILQLTISAPVGLHPISKSRPVT
jgi:hypothetical protein